MFVTYNSRLSRSKGTARFENGEHRRFGEEKAIHNCDVVCAIGVKSIGLIDQ